MSARIWVREKVKDASPSPSSSMRPISEMVLPGTTTRFSGISSATVMVFLANWKESVATRDRTLPSLSSSTPDRAGWVSSRATAKAVCSMIRLPFSRSKVMVKVSSPSKVISGNSSYSMHWSWFTFRPQRMVKVWPSTEKKALPSGSLRTMSEKMRPRTTHSPASSTMADSRHSFWSVRSEQRSITPSSPATIWTPSSTGMEERTGRALMTESTPSFNMSE